MKIVVFGNHQRVGAVDGDQVVDLNRVNPRIPSTLESFIAGGRPVLDDAQRVIEDVRGRDVPGSVSALTEVKLHAPWPGRRIACMGGNYADHLMGMDSSGSSETVTLESITQNTRAAGQWGFWKVLIEVAGPDDPIIYPMRTEYFDYEAEAAIVIGKRGKNIRAADIEQYVWGVTLLNDWSIRDGMATGAAQRPMSYNVAKNFDGSASMGPCIVAGEIDPAQVDVELRLNGELRQRFNTGDMIFSFGEALAYLSRDFTFVPEDIIAGGTAADKTKPSPDVGRARELFLKVNDVVEIRSPQIGVLRNRVVGAQ